jgi:hypothetical protein
MSNVCVLPFFSPNAAALGEGMLIERASASCVSRVFLGEQEMAENKTLTGEEKLDEVDERRLVELLRAFRVVQSASVRITSLEERELERWKRQATRLARELLEILLGRSPTDSEVDGVSGIQDSPVVTVTELAYEFGLRYPVEFTREAYYRMVRCRESARVRGVLWNISDAFRRAGNECDKVWMHEYPDSMDFVASLQRGYYDSLVVVVYLPSE